MRKLAYFVLALSILLASSCSDEGNGKARIDIAPPSWIYGTWQKTDKELSFGSIGYKFAQGKVYDMERDSDGSIYYLDWEDCASFIIGYMDYFSITDSVSMDTYYLSVRFSHSLDGVSHVYDYEYSFKLGDGYLTYNEFRYYDGESYSSEPCKLYKSTL